MSKNPLGRNENHSMNRTYAEVDTCESVGIADVMPGTHGGFTMAAFTAESVPVGTRLYKAPLAKPINVRWNTGNPPVKSLSYGEYIVALRRNRDPKILRYSAFYFDNFSFDSSGPKTGWFSMNQHGITIPLLREGDELLGWADFPEWEEPEQSSPDPVNMFIALKPFAAFADALAEDVPETTALALYVNGCVMFGPSGGANVGALRRARDASAGQAVVDVKYEQLQRDYDALKKLCERAETAAAEAQVELQRMRTAQNSSADSQYQEAWFAVCDTLNRVSPDWGAAPLCGRDAACTAIEKLAKDGQ